MTGGRRRSAAAWDSKVYRSLQKQFRRRRRRRRLAALLGLVACGWLFVDSYPRAVKMKDCGLRSQTQFDPGYVHVGGGLRERTAAVFTSTGAVLKPWYSIAIAPGSEDFVAVRRSRWGGEFRLLSVDLRSRSDGEVFRRNIGRIDQACWTDIKRHISEEWTVPGIKIIDEDAQASG